MIDKIKSYVSKVDFEIEISKDKKRLITLITIEVIFVILTLIIQEYLRSNMLFKSDIGIFMMGILPSFFGAGAYVLILFVFYRLVQGYYQKFDLKVGLIFANFFTFLGLTLWELIRTVIHSFDWWDVLASSVGCLSATILILSLYINDKKINNEKNKI